ncbi:MAG: hypothetical protein CME06_00440 [Gemmatimonadetes bacterium]|nr:hypothetical protein [Gemmatimonadota bacterium]
MKAGPTLGIHPVVHEQWMKMAVIGAAFLVTLLLSGRVVGRLAGPRTSAADDEADGRDSIRRDTGRVIGKCENLLTVTFILLGQETGLALIIGAKSIVRGDEMRRDPQYYLGGTLVNLAWGVLVAFVARTLIAGL